MNEYKSGYRVVQRRQTLMVDLVYPGEPGRPDKIEIGLEHVRAADSLRISYDFERDGWRIEQQPERGPTEDYDPEEWREVAFIRAWGCK